MQSTYPVSAGKIGAIAVGFVGILLVSISGIAFATNSSGYCKEVDAFSANHTSVQTTVLPTSNRSNSTTIDDSTLRKRQCTPFTLVELAMSLLALIGGSLMWSISSGMSFQSSNQGGGVGIKRGLSS